LRSAEPDRLIAFYEAAFAPLGIAKLSGWDGGAGFGASTPGFWIGGAAAASSCHIAFTAVERASVDAFHKAALAAGGKDNGSPGIRADYGPTYYAAFVIDPDGNNIEAVCHLA
jgi:catechol 2,3-dioxygenase-like lactoylglutathione lyase family enzyme